MAKKPKIEINEADAGKPADEMLEQPAAMQPTETPVRLEWPESTEVRELDTDLNDEQLVERGLSLVMHLGEAESLANQKKSSAERFKVLIEEQQEVIDTLSLAIRAKKDRIKTPCRWVFQSNGYDADGALLFHSELKTLVREDTGAVVEIKPITADDRQLHLALGDEETLDGIKQQIEDAGFEVVEAPGEPGDGEAPFLLVGPNGSSPIHADSMAAALRIAAAEWSEQSAPTDEADEAEETKDEFEA